MKYQDSKQQRTSQYMVYGMDGIKTRDCFVKAIPFTRPDKEEKLTPPCFLSGPE